MPLVPMRILLDHAAENNYGIAALNVNNMEQIQAIMEAARETESPVIIQASRGARQYTNDAFLRHLMLAAVELSGSAGVGAAAHCYVGPSNCILKFPSPCTRTMATARPRASAPSARISPA